MPGLNFALNPTLRSVILVTYRRCTSIILWESCKLESEIADMSVYLQTIYLYRISFIFETKFYRLSNSGAWYCKFNHNVFYKYSQRIQKYKKYLKILSANDYVNMWARFITSIYFNNLIVQIAMSRENLNRKLEKTSQNFIIWVIIVIIRYWYKFGPKVYSILWKNL